MANSAVQAGKRSKKKMLDYKAVFASDEGRAVLYDMMNAHHFLKPALTSKNDPIEAAFNEGQRNVILRILTYVNMDVEQIDTLIKEGERNVKDVYARIRGSANA